MSRRTAAKAAIESLKAKIAACDLEIAKVQAQVATYREVMWELEKAQDGAKKAKKPKVRPSMATPVTSLDDRSQNPIG